MTEYYFVLSALPPLSIGVKPELSFKEVQAMLELNLAQSDREKVVLLLRQIDLYNLRALWLGLPLDDRGNLSGKQLEEALLVKDPFPPYLVDFIERYDTPADRLRYFSSLYASFYQQEAVQATGFLRNYYKMEREVRLVLTAIRAKKRGRDLIRELQFEDPQDPFVAHILAQKEASDYLPPQEYEDLKALFMENSQEPKELHLELLRYRFRKIEEIEEQEVFSIDCVLGYIARLLLVEESLFLERDKGNAALEELSRYG